MLHEFLESKRSDIIARTKVKVAARPAPRVTETELTEGVPLFVDQLIETLKGSPLPDEMSAAATKRGNDMLRMGFTVGQVVHDYGDLCQAVTELAFELDANITVDEFHTLNRCLDNAIAEAVTEYGRMREQSLTDQGTERVGALAHELRNHLTTATLSFGILRSGAVPISGSTGALHERSLKGLNDLIERSLADIRLESTMRRRETILLAEFVEEVEIAAGIEAKVHGHELTVATGRTGRSNRGGPRAARHGGNSICFRTHSSSLGRPGTSGSGRVQLPIASSSISKTSAAACPPDKPRSSFVPSSSAARDRSGLGLGLSISRKAVQANGGDIQVRNLPGKACIFTIALPRKLGLAPRASSDPS